jgi:NRPS condensation-like uncharacterized protein
MKIFKKNCNQEINDRTYKMFRHTIEKKESSITNFNDVIIIMINKSKFNLIKDLLKIVNI